MLLVLFDTAEPPVAAAGAACSVPAFRASLLWSWAVAACDELVLPLFVLAVP